MTVLHDVEHLDAELRTPRLQAVEPREGPSAMRASASHVDAQVGYARGVGGLSGGPRSERDEEDHEQ